MRRRVFFIIICILHSSLLLSLLRQRIWLFLMRWWSWIRRFSRLPSCIEIVSFYSLGRTCINWNHLNFIFCDKRYFSFKNSQQWSFPSLAKSCPTELIPFFEKLEKMTHLLSIWMSLVSHEIERLLMIGEKMMKIGIHSSINYFLIAFRKDL